MLRHRSKGPCASRCVDRISPGLPLVYRRTSADRDLTDAIDLATHCGAVPSLTVLVAVDVFLLPEMVSCVSIAEPAIAAGAALG